LRIGQTIVVRGEWRWRRWRIGEIYLEEVGVRRWEMEMEIWGMKRVELE
jgi:hypothetical protein